MKSPVKQTTMLYRLQTHDSQRDKHLARLEQIEAELKENEAVQAAEAAVQQAQDTLEHWQTRRSEIRQQRQGLQREAEGFETRLYSGEVTNSRELEDMQGKVAELKGRIEALADPEAEAELMIEEWQAELTRTQESAAQVQEEHADTLGELVEERDALQANVAELDEKIAQTRERIKPEHLETYDTLRKRPGGLAVSKLNRDGECSGCGIQVTTRIVQQVKRGSIVQCPTCKRILST